MILVEYSIKFRIAMAVVCLILIIFGAIAYNSLPLESFPEVVIPYVIVSSRYEGVSPADMETLVTMHIEKKLKGLEDVKEIRSSSAEGFSLVSVEFNPDVDIDTALQKVRDKVDQAKGDLPDDMDDPEVDEVNFSSIPIVYINLYGNDINPVKLKQIAEDLQDKIEAVQGVLSAPIFGGLEREIRVEFDPQRLSYYKLTLQEIVTAIKSNNANTPGGNIEMNGTKYMIKIPGEFDNPLEINNLVLLVKNGKPIYLTDVASIRDTFKDRLTYSRLNGKDSITIGVQKRAGENIVNLTEKIKQLVDEESVKFPKNVKYVFTSEQSKFIKRMVADLKNNIITALILVITIVFITLGFRNAIFISIAIPLSMLITFIVLNLKDTTLNMIVLFSLILASGMLVDNGIVLVENIYRHMMMKKSKLQASIDGANEVAWPIITSTLTTVAAFVPLMSWPGIIGEFMYYLPFTVNIVLLASLFVALMINPPLCSLYMSVKKKVNINESEAESENIHPILKYYRLLLVKSINHSTFVIIFCVVLFIAVFIVYGKFNHGVEFFPNTEPDIGFVRVKTSEGSTLDLTDGIIKRLEPIVAEYKDIKNYISSVGSSSSDGLVASGEKANRADITLEFVDEDKRVKKSSEIIEELRGKIKSSAGIEIEIVKEEGGPPTGKPINIELSGDKYEILSAMSQKIKDSIKGVQGAADIKDDYMVGVPEIKIRIDRVKSALLGLSTLEIAETIKTAFNGRELGVLREVEKEFDITARLPEKDRKDLEQIKNLLIPSRVGEPVPLSSVAQIITSSGVASVQHVDQKRTITITGNIKKGFNNNKVRAKVMEIVNKMKFPSGYRVTMTGESEEQDKASAFLTKAFMLAVFFVALIIVTQFNSIVFAFIIMSSVLMSLIGVLLGLLATNTPFGIIMTGIGVISLAGVVVNNAIVLLDFIQVQRRSGKKLTDALVYAGVTRFRPVMLTAITTIFGLLPLAFGVSYNFLEWKWDIGSTSVMWWKPMAVAVVFGLTFATLLTLVFVPTLYYFLWRIKHFILRLLKREKPGQAA